jgi:hypothetical protein
MWFREYRDYKIDEPAKKSTVSPGKGITGCEMHELQGWGNTLQKPKKRPRKGVLATLITYLFSRDKQEVP